jgi:putative transposase
VDKFKNKYRIASARTQWWDYSQDGSYFLTICTKDRKCSFGDIRGGKMMLSEIGIIANACWSAIKEHAKNIELGNYVVMPNHVHGILTLDGNPPSETIGKLRFQNPGSNSISTIIGGYKPAVSKHARRAGVEFEWQTRFHDHVIRDEEEYERITNYILRNPSNWEEDRFFLR